jgi:pimeloyl-ACP methyl ester carboxylesterase
MTTSAKPARWKRWLKRAGLGFLLLLVLIVAIGAAYEALERCAAARRYPPPGRLVDIGGRRIHIDCRGSGSPTVIFEAGLGTGGSIDWSLVHDKVAAFTRTCAYDRAGIMWSDPKNIPHDGAAVADDLHATLRAAGISDPIVLVGHSIGGPYATIYAAKYGDQVAGLVLVDPSHPDQVARLGRAVKANVDPGSKAGILKIASALSWTGIVRFVMSRQEVPHLPSEESAKMAAYSSTSAKAAVSELTAFDQTMNEARAAHDFGNRPLVVLTAMAPLPAVQLRGMGITPRQGRLFKQTWQILNAEEARWSTRGRQQIVADASHYIQLDRPDVVISSVRQVVDIVRADASAKAPATTRTDAP